MSNSAKIVNYQGLRGIAFLLIFISHCAFSVNEHGLNSTSYFGAFGVSLFIILSGFLTAHNHYDSKELSSTEQITKTIKKCYPLHFLTFLLSIPPLLKAANIKTWIISAMNLALIQSWVPKGSVYFSNNAVSWYLSTYLFLMLISPFIVKYLKQATSTRIISLLIINLSIQVSLVLFTGGYGWAHWIIYICPITRSLDFISGGVLQYL